MVKCRRPSATAAGALVAPLFAVLFLPTVMATAQGQTAKNEHKVTLRVIMQELGAEYMRLASALLMDDFKSVEESAKAIQSHPLPDDIVAAIKKKLGKSFHAFERVDGQSHQRAGEVVKRAVARDISGAARAFGALTGGCVSCHKQFRAALKSVSD